MLDYYQILGVESTASVTEIKSAFRTLAKLYHPDKNENGKEFFTQLLMAYETLCDQRARSRYDYQYKLFKQQGENKQADKQTQNTKTWRFDDKEMKRRQYYNEHFKSKAKEQAPLSDFEINKTNYNEFKYVFYAIPLAVILFLFLIKMAQSNAIDYSAKPMNVSRNK